MAYTYKVWIVDGKEHFEYGNGQTRKKDFAVVQKVIRSFALVEFTHNGESYLGQIHISEFTKLGYGYIGNLSEIVHIDDEYRTALLDYHEKYERWNLQIIPQELE